MEGIDEVGIVGREDQARTAGQFVEGDRYGFGTGFELGQARHVMAVDRCGVAVVALPETVGLVLEVVSDRLDLIGVGRIVGHHGLDEPGVGGLEAVRDGIEFEGHHLRSDLGDLGPAIGKPVTVVGVAREVVQQPLARSTRCPSFGRAGAVRQLASRWARSCWPWSEFCLLKARLDPL